jgi:hypothetical protein
VIITLTTEGGAIIAMLLLLDTYAMFVNAVEQRMKNFATQKIVKT